MTCPYINAAPASLNLNDYLDLHRDRKRLIQSWFKRAHKRRECSHKESFEPFIFAWISFNGWASCVTGEDRDAKMVRRVANCAHLRQLFMDLVSFDPNFASVMNRFAKLWPIFKTQDVQRYGYYSAPSDSREETIQKYLHHTDIDFAPKCALDHVKHGEVIPRDWPHTLHTIYRVRCNLFHGGKSPHLENDVLIVQSACDVLMDFLTKTKIIKPNH